MTATKEPRPAKARPRPKAAPWAKGKSSASPTRWSSTPRRPRDAPEFYGFDIVPPPDRPPQTEREREVYTLGDGEMLVNMGPQHPSTHGVMRIVLKVRGEVVIDLDPVLGYLHRGIEKLCENATYTTVMTYVDPMDYMSAMHNEHAPAIAFEKLYGIKAPRRAEYIRALVVELNRVFSHGLMMGFLALDLGGLTPILYSFINRDQVVDLLSAISGQRMLFNFFRVGGVNFDTNDEFLSRLGTWRAGVLEDDRDEREDPDRERDLRRPHQGDGRAHRAAGDRRWASAARTCGPAACRSTCARRTRTHLPRARVRGHHPVGRRHVRPLHAARGRAQAVHPPDRPDRGHACRTARSRPRCRASFAPRPGRAYAAVESPRGLYSVYAISDGGPNPYRFRMRDPSFVSLQVMPKLMPGRLIADTMAVMASLDPIMGGVDK